MLSFCATLTLFFPCCGNGVYSQQKLYTNLLQFLIEFLILLSCRRKFCTWNTVKNCRKCWKKKKLFRWFLFNKNIVVALVEHQQLSNHYYCYYVVFSSVAFYSKKKKTGNDSCFSMHLKLFLFYFFDKLELEKPKTGNEKYLCWNR